MGKHFGMFSSNLKWFTTEQKEGENWLEHKAAG